MKFINIFVIITVLFLTILSAVNRPVMHKTFVLTNQNFKLDRLNPQQLELQSVPMFRIGDAPTRVVKAPKQQIKNSETPIIPSDVNIIPSDFIQTVHVNNNQQVQNTAPPKPNNSDEMLKQVGKMLDTEVDLPSSEPQDKNTKPALPKNTQTENETPSGCTICDALLDPKVRSELIAWNKWRSDVQNRIMETSYVEAPYGTLFFFSFKVDRERNIYNIKIMSSKPNTESDIRNIKAAIEALKGDKILQFPEKSNRKSINFSGGFLMSDYEELSSPSDFRDFEYIQTTY